MSAADKMSLFGTLTYVSIAVAVLGLALAVFFFFHFDIPSIYALRTGKAKRQTIERMSEQNSRTGRLQSRPSGGLKDPGTPVVQQPARAVTADIGPAADAYSVQQPTVRYPEMNETSVLGATATETTVLGGGVPETSVLNQTETDSGATVVLTPNPPAPAAAPSEPQIRFEVTETTLVIHTDDLI